MSSDNEKNIFADFLERDNSSWLRKAPLQTLPAAEWGSEINSVNYKALAHRSRKVCHLEHHETQHVFTESKRSRKK